MDEEDDKESNDESNRQSVAYPDIKMERLYESKQGSQTLKTIPFLSQDKNRVRRESLP